MTDQISDIAWHLARVPEALEDARRIREVGNPHNALRALVDVFHSLQWLSRKYTTLETARRK